MADQKGVIKREADVHSQIVANVADEGIKYAMEHNTRLIFM